MSKIRVKPLPTRARLEELFSYDPETGWLLRKVRTSMCVKVGDRVGWRAKNGYWEVTVDAERYYAHRIVWALCYGGEIPDQIDHVNGVKDDNRLVNLRLASRSENNANRGVPNKKSPTHLRIKGVQWHKGAGKYMSQIAIRGKRHYLGLFGTAEEAKAAYDAAAYQAFGDFVYQEEPA